MISATSVPTQFAALWVGGVGVTPTWSRHKPRSPDRRGYPVSAGRHERWYRSRFYANAWQLYEGRFCRSGFDLERFRNVIRDHARQLNNKLKGSEPFTVQFRRGTNRDYALGNSRFRQQIEGTLGRRAQPGKSGRPTKQRKA